MPTTQQVQLCPHARHRSTPHEHATSGHRPGTVYERTPGTPSMYTPSCDGLWGKGMHVTQPPTPGPIEAGDRVRFVERYRARGDVWVDIGTEATVVRRDPQAGRSTMLTLRCDAVPDEFQSFEFRVERVDVSPTGIAVGTEIPGGQLSRIIHEGLSLRCTSRAIRAASGAHYAIGCQSFRVDELLDNGGSIGQSPSHSGFYDVQFNARIANGRFMVAGRDALSIGDANSHVLTSVVTDVPSVPPPPVVRVVEAQPRLYRCSAHREEHFFLMQPKGTDRDVAIARVDLRRGTVADRFEPSDEGFTKWPDCRPDAGPTLTRLEEGRAPDVRHVRVGDGQLTGNVTISTA
jgi:hypothetical protein